ncbi:MAG: hypothetical protein ACOC2J_02775 [bacterium]
MEKYKKFLPGFGLFLSLLGIFLSVLLEFKDNLTVLGLTVFTLFFIVFGTIFICFFYYNYKTKEGEYQKKSSAIRISNKNLINDFWALNKGFNKNITNLFNKELEYYKKLQNNNNEDEVKREYYEKFRTVNKLFYRTVIDELQNLVEEYLKTKGIYLNVCLNVKHIICGSGSKEDQAILYFIDNRTYKSGEREVDQSYIIRNNTSLSYVYNSYKESTPEKSIYINNFIERCENSYVDDTDDYLKHYNAIIVVPILDNTLDQEKNILGFLCCDVKREKIYFNSDIFDKLLGKILLSGAEIIGVYHSYYNNSIILSNFFNNNNI